MTTDNIRLDGRSTSLHVPMTFKDCHKVQLTFRPPHCLEPFSISLCVKLFGASSKAPFERRGGVELQGVLFMFNIMWLHCSMEAQNGSAAERSHLTVTWLPGSLAGNA